MDGEKGVESSSRVILFFFPLATPLPHLEHLGRVDGLPGRVVIRERGRALRGKGRE